MSDLRKRGPIARRLAKEEKARQAQMRRDKQAFAAQTKAIDKAARLEKRALREIERTERRARRSPFTHAHRYECCGLVLGWTVADWERFAGLPPYSVYPDARHAERLTGQGFFMYRRPTWQEELEMATERGRQRLAVANAA